MTQPPDFEALYAADSDPGRVGSSFYERRKRDLVLAALSQPRYEAAWDPACGTGHLAARLGGRCDSVLATDASPAAVELTRRTCAGVPAVQVATNVLPARPDATPAAGFELVVVAEFVYYLGAATRAATLDLVHRATSAGAELLAVHWRPRPDDAYLSGADVQAEIVARLAARGWRPRVHLDDPAFVLDTLRRGSGREVPR